ncbi:MAG: hypothetical protein ACTSRI_08185 [Promethearchaeota archaeon]
MNIFKWIKEIEKTYEGLIENSRRESSAEIQLLKENEEKERKKILREKKDFISSILINLSEEIQGDIIKFEKKNDDLIKKIEKDFQNNKVKLVNLLLEKMGYDF